MSSKLGQLATDVADWLGSAAPLVALWDTAPAAMWTPEWTREGLSTSGLMAAVFPQGSEPSLLTRSGGPGDDSVTILHIAVMLPMEPITSEQQRFENGDRTVEAAEAIIEHVLGTVVAGWRCVSVEHDPVISKDFARENRTWVSYLKTNWMRSGL